eukprot:TRINITY_DN776_c0_g1_i23.p1 TRINITY_DN776_c0_g1~~TRINITY_DN776_c0_g1_i23.p1  ORF type:complete len:344 (+),score=59.74 TRINITY_DN776_c0_g1_i23:111-1142(+)
MHTESYVISIDEGTSSARAVLYDHQCRSLFNIRHPVVQTHPQPGWVEQDPLHLLEITRKCLHDLHNAVQKENIVLSTHNIKGIGLTNQRETTIVWDKITGKPLFNAIVWLDTRTKDLVSELISLHGADKFREKTGLPISTYFSVFKLMWLVQNVEAVRVACDAGTCLFGTVDTWLLWNLTGGVEGGVHATDVTNASRTMLFNINDLSWDKDLLQTFSIPSSILPVVKSSSEVYGTIKLGNSPFDGVQITSCVGDQQAALVGQLCLDTGMAKCTFGTGCFLLYNTGGKIVHSKAGLITTIGYQIGSSGPVSYALEGSLPIAGAGVEWLKNNLGVIYDANDLVEC